MRRKLFVVSMAAICIAVTATGTLAYFNSSGTARNVITAGNLRMELVETAIPEDGGPAVPFEDLDGVMPGTEASKIVRVKNTGDFDAYIRIAVEKDIILDQDAEGEADVSLVTMDFNEENWTYKEGFYYYKKPLSAGKITEPLFTTVTFDRTMDNRYQNSKAEIIVKAYATQVANNGTDPLNAQGWPEE